ncbi:MAG: ABC transporter substrate-binding protein [Treponema sp.]|nr:ABC transporter substrate-binding protein [Treponema sp.]
MKRFVCFFIILCLAVSLVFAGGGREHRPRGKIVIYTSMYDEAIVVLKSELQKQFPRCNFEFITRGTGIIQGWIEAERLTGRLGCDILMVAEPAYALELKEAGLLHAFKTREAAALAFDYDPDGYWYPVRVSNMVLAFNPERHTRDSIPNSFFGFANDPRVRGAVSMRNPLVSGTTMATASALRDKYGYQYFEALGRQMVAIDYGSDESMTKLETGECSVVMILEESILRKREKENSHLEVIYPTDGTVVIPSPIMVINQRWSANRNAATAEVIASWFLSPAGQNAIVNSWMHSVREDIPSVPYNSISLHEIRANNIPIIWENVLRQRAEIRRRFEIDIRNR